MVPKAATSIALIGSGDPSLALTRGPATTAFHTSVAVTVLRFTLPGSRKEESWLTGVVTRSMPARLARFVAAAAGFEPTVVWIPEKRVGTVTTSSSGGLFSDFRTDAVQVHWSAARVNGTSVGLVKVLRRSSLLSPWTRNSSGLPTNGRLGQGNQTGGVVADNGPMGTGAGARTGGVVNSLFQNDVVATSVFRVVLLAFLPGGTVPRTGSGVRLTISIVA